MKTLKDKEHITMMVLKSTKKELEVAREKVGILEKKADEFSRKLSTIRTDMYILDTTGTLEISDTEIIVKNNGHGYPSINGWTVSYDTKEIRETIHPFFEANPEFILPKKYTYVITEVNQFAKIIER